MTATTGALIIAALMVSAAFTFISTTATTVNGSTADPATIIGMSGTVEIEVNGSNEWRPLVPSDIIRPGDMVMTGANGQLLIGLGNVGQIRFGEQTNFTTSVSDYTGSDPPVSGANPACHLHLGLHYGGRCHVLKLVIGSLWASIQEALGGSDAYETSIGDSAAVGIRGTEFTATAYENGTANVTMLDGLVEVQDLASNSTVSLQANQTITIPSVSGGLSEQDLTQRVSTVNPNSIDRWWETPITTPSSTLLQSMYVVGAVVAAAAVAAGVLVLYTRRKKGNA